ncbi:dihydrolipoyllysine-residue succinyltransferase component of 2-oxoglutarate dehydrogenase complex, mitochondrial-like [Oppia nitens]|uniref:dihydrolipoyllysine-residue succinyltransferase component of 2-oxoglutarate dehydrogenase complex, mitochondrial-like n=1 Tax=Oppia nitens TaxID=1686743 RepID=UPI0023DC8C5A|nr:dihydrolipoyllysine-residue succinyltransferase component of 2-oxoglutarate dehydrogenase complex, mitochondrial-like [Oppia nitens]
MAALLNRSLIRGSVKNCSLSHRWRAVCPSVTAIRVNPTDNYHDIRTSMELPEMSLTLSSADNPLIKTNHSLSYSTLHLQRLQNRFCPNNLFKKFRDNSLRSSSCRQFHRSAITFNEVKVVVVPPLAESLSEGDIRWDKAVGDTVAEDEVIGEVETDKTSVPIHSPVAGVIEELLVEDGSTVQPGKAVLKIRVGGAGGVAAPKKADKAEAHKAAPEATVKAPAPPSKEIPTTPPPLPSRPLSPLSSTPVTPIKQKDSFGESGVTIGTRKENRVKINRMRQRIAQRLKDAQNTYAMLTTFNEIDMSNAIEMRNTYKDIFQKKHNLKLGFMSAFVKATAYALQDQPIVNAVIDESEIVYRDYVDISVAVATPKGLVVPVIRSVETMSYADIEKTINALGEKARSGSLAIEDMDGGTFTISNGGVFGSMFGTPIINPPQSAILGMHAIIERPVVINHKIEVRPMMYVCLTYDHRLIDGREAVTFLRKIKAAVEDPRIMFLEI